MIIYWAIWMYICLCNILTSYNKVFSKIIFIFTAFFLFFIIGFRYEVGGDWFNYLFFYDLAKYEQLSSIILGPDMGYNLLNYMGNHLGFKDTIFVNAVCAAIVVGCLLNLALKWRYYWLLLLSYFPYHILAVSMGYTRQSVAIALSLLAFHYLFQQRIQRFLIYIILAALFHKTAVVLLLFAPIVLQAKFKSNHILYSLYMFFSLIIISLMMYYFSLQEQNLYLQGNEELSSKGFFLRWAYHTIPLGLYWFYRQQFQHKIQQHLLDFFVLLIVYMLFLGIAFSTLADRLNLYLVFFDLYVLNAVFAWSNLKSRLILLFILMGSYTLFMWLWFFQGVWALQAWVPYQNYIAIYLRRHAF
ncbi:EpsG family protein [Acinetobacter larvae]|uniref:EpsG family protein n=1 Tax=Acinetobacter larvae TaxID=1789224 RepID=A0A1B2LVP3_9GAMM|nr:EpsG family protein [Acinetobacter larvae]AOA56997.1 hypothetical protein BFG52_00570 [Acinetobacter larvae]